jgi:hypothetical protein
VETIYYILFNGPLSLGAVNIWQLLSRIRLLERVNFITNPLLMRKEMPSKYTPATAPNFFLSSVDATVQ